MSIVETQEREALPRSSRHRQTAVEQATRWLREHLLLIYVVLAFAYLFLPIAYVTVFSFNEPGRSQPHLARLHPRELDQPVRCPAGVRGGRQQPQDRCARHALAPRFSGR